MAHPTDHVKKKTKKTKKPKDSKIPLKLQGGLENANVPTFIPDPDASPFSDPYDLYENYGSYMIDTNYTRTKLLSANDELMDPWPTYLTRGSEKGVNTILNRTQQEQNLNLLTLVKDYGIRLAGNIGPWDLGVFGQGNSFTMSTGATTPIPLGKLFDET